MYIAQNDPKVSGSAKDGFVSGSGAFLLNSFCPLCMSNYRNCCCKDRVPYFEVNV